MRSPYTPYSIYLTGTVDFPCMVKGFMVLDLLGWAKGFRVEEGTQLAE